VAVTTPPLARGRATSPRSSRVLARPARLPCSRVGWTTCHRCPGLRSFSVPCLRCTPICSAKSWTWNPIDAPAAGHSPVS